MMYDDDDDNDDENDDKDDDDYNDDDVGLAVSRYCFPPQLFSSNK